jgi:hypothetical protein
MRTEFGGHDGAEESFLLQSMKCLQQGKASRILSDKETVIGSHDLTREDGACTAPGVPTWPIAQAEWPRINGSSSFSPTAKAGSASGEPPLPGGNSDVAQQISAFPSLIGEP